MNEIDWENEETIMVPYAKRFRVTFDTGLVRTYFVKNASELRAALRGIGVAKKRYKYATM